MGIPLRRQTSTSRTPSDVLADKTGSGIAESLGGVALTLIAVGLLGLGVASNMSAVSTIATKAERQALITSLVGHERSVSTWGTKTAPKTDNVVLPNGHTVKVTTWRETTPVSTELTAVVPISADADAADCTKPADVSKPGCIYATRLHAAELDAIKPHAIIRKDPSMGTAAAIGTVDARVGTSTSIPQGVAFASGKDSESTVWRYLIKAGSLEETSEIRISQDGKTLAQIPVDKPLSNYFGTLTAKPNVPVVATVTEGNALVNTIFIYRAGSTE